MKHLINTVITSETDGENMKIHKRYLILLCLVISSLSFSQESEQIIVKHDYGTQNVAMMDLFRLQGTDYYQFNFSADSFKNKLFEISYIEYTDGISSDEEMLINNEDMTSLMGLLQDDSEFYFRVISQKMTPDSVKFLFIFLDRMGKDQTYHVFEKKPSYSLRTPLKTTFKDDSGNANQGDKISVGEKIPFMVYSLPYADPNGGFQYCQLTAESIPPEEWGKHYGIKHYIIFYLKIRTN